MCTNIMVCYGDISPKTQECDVQPFYITNDGKYAVPMQFVEMDENGEPKYPEKDTPKYEIKIIKKDIDKE
jgi:hypothetical protein